MERKDLDRRPIYLINMFGANYDTDPVLGLAPWWEDQDEDPIQGLITRIQAGFDLGYKRFCLNRPTGEALDNSAFNLASSLFEPMPSWKQDDLINVFKPWWEDFKETNTDVELSLYGGWRIRDDYDVTEVSTSGGAHQVDLDNEDDAAFTLDSWEEWVDIGVTRFIADNTSPSAQWANWTKFYREWRFNDFFPDKVVVGTSEAIPQDAHVPDTSRIYDTPSLALWRFIRSHEADSHTTWTADPRRTEHYVAIQGDNEYSGEFEAGGFTDAVVLATKNDLKDLARNGYILFSWAAPSDAREWIIELTTVTAPTVNANGSTLNWAHIADTEDDGTPIETQYYEVWKATDKDGEYEFFAETADATYTVTNGFWYYVKTVSEYNAISDPSNIIFAGTGTGNDGDTEDIVVDDDFEDTNCLALLDAYNLMLRARGEEPITTLETEDLTLSMIAPTLEQCKRDILMKGWQFNTDSVVFTPDINGVINVPKNTYLSIRYPRSMDQYLIERNGKIFNRKTRENWASEFRAEVVLDLPFCEIPRPFQNWIAYSAATRVILHADGATGDLQWFTKMEIDAKKSACNSERVSMDGLYGSCELFGGFS